MPKYIVVISKKAKKQLDSIPDNIVQPIFDAITQMADQPRPIGYKKLKGRPGYRIRVGNFRIIYEIIDQELIVNVVAVGDRKEVYD